MNREQFFNSNLEIEILSIAMNDNKAIDTIMELKEDNFYFEKNKNIAKVRCLCDIHKMMLDFLESFYDII